MHNTASSRVYSDCTCRTSSLRNLGLVTSSKCPGSWSQRFGAESKHVFRIFCGTYPGSGCHCVLSSWEGTWDFWVWHLSDSKSLVLSTLPRTLLKPFCSKSCTQYCTAGFDWRLISLSHRRKWETYCSTSTVAAELLLPYPDNLFAKRKQAEKRVSLEGAGGGVVGNFIPSFLLLIAPWVRLHLWSLLPLQPPVYMNMPCRKKGKKKKIPLRLAIKGEHHCLSTMFSVSV